MASSPRTPQNPRDGQSGRDGGGGKRPRLSLGTFYLFVLIALLALAAPGAVPTFQVAVARVRRIRFFRGAVASKAKLHVTLGHATVMAELLLFVEAPGAAAVAGTGGGGEELIETDWDLKAPFDAAGEYAYLPELADPATAAGAGEREGEAPTVTECWALLRFEQPVTCPADSMLIGSRLDFDAHAKACRLAVDRKDGIFLLRITMTEARVLAELGEAEGIGEAELGPVVEESQTKLYEDYLHDLGLATLGLRFRRHERGWEARLRWWAVVNPSGTPHRGVPHARLCDTSYSCVVGAALRLERRVAEKSLSEAESGDGLRIQFWVRFFERS
mgnify:CR=1 FL=1